MFKRLFTPKQDDTTAWLLYAAAVEQARRHEFYDQLDVPDTLDGRFELISLHVYLLLRRLRREHERTDKLAQRVFDAMFADMDRSLREMGAGDVGVGPKVKKMAKAFYGRISAYDAGVDGEAGMLEDALRRNLYGTVPEPDPDSVGAMAEYLRSNDAALARQGTDALMAGRIAFGPPRVPPAPRPAQAG